MIAKDHRDCWIILPTAVFSHQRKNQTGRICCRVISSSSSGLLPLAVRESTSGTRWPSAISCPASCDDNTKPQEHGDVPDHLRLPRHNCRLVPFTHARIDLRMEVPTIQSR